MYPIKMKKRGDNLNNSVKLYKSIWRKERKGRNVTII